MFKNDQLFFEIHTWVVHVVPGSWTAQDAEDLTDDLEAEIFSAVEAGSANKPQWVSLQHDGRATVTMEILNVGWLHQVIPVACTVTRGKSRRTVREELADYLTQLVVSAQSVYSYQPAYFGAVSQASEVESPVVYVASSGSERAN